MVLLAASLRLYWLLCRQERAEQWAWGLAAIFISPLIVGIVLALMPDKGSDSVERLPQSSGGYREDKAREGKRCPECGYLADAGEQYCPRCGEMLW